MGPTSSRSSPRRASATAGRRRSQEQLDAACGEARAQGLRSMVHAHSPESMMRAARANCTVVEHGARDAGSLPAAGRAWRLVRSEHWIRDAELFGKQAALSRRRKLHGRRLRGDGKGAGAEIGDVLGRAETPKPEMVMGTDAVAGAHGRTCARRWSGSRRAARWTPSWQ